MLMGGGNPAGVVRGGRRRVVNSSCPKRYGSAILQHFTQTTRRYNSATFNSDHAPVKFGNICPRHYGSTIWHNLAIW